VASPYSSGGGGHFLEAKVATSALVALVCQSGFRGLVNGVVAQVASQRKSFGDPLDDLVIRGETTAGKQTSLRLQITNELAFTVNNPKWRDVLGNAWDTFASDGFDPRYDRIGAGIGVYSKVADEAYQTVFRWARESSDGDDFAKRIGKQGFSSSAMQRFVSAIEQIIREDRSAEVENEQLWKFLRCFVLIHFDFQSGDSSREKNHCIEQIAKRFPGHDPRAAKHIWLYLFEKVSAFIPAGGSATRVGLLNELVTAGLVHDDPFATHTSAEHGLSAREYVRRQLVQAVARHSAILNGVSFLDEPRTLEDAYVPTKLLRAESTDEGGQSTRSYSATGAVDKLLLGNHIIEGSAGSGKSTLLQWLANKAAQKLLIKSEKSDLSGDRLPVLVEASALAGKSIPFVDALSEAANAEHSLALSSAVTSNFLNPYSDGGHRFWTILIDGIDELDSRRSIARFCNALETVKANFGDAFRFILGTRPGAVSRDALSDFERWHMLPLDDQTKEEVSLKYLRPDCDIQVFLEQAANAELGAALETPLVCELAAAVFSQTGSLPSGKSALVDAYIAVLFGKPSLADLDRQGLVKLHVAISEKSFDVGSPSTDILTACNAATLPKLAQSQAVIEVVHRVGLAQCTSEGFKFRHELLWSYFTAQRLGTNENPSRKIWAKIDPFEVGWPTIEFLCQNWENAGHDVSEAVDALRAFGDDGLRCAVDILAMSAVEAGKIATDITERVLREAKSTGVMTWHTQILPKLARRFEEAAELIEAEVYSKRWHMGLRLECANCLVQAGLLADGIDALIAISTDKSEYHWDRVRAASDLCEVGEIEKGLPVLREMITDADEICMRLDAAVSIKRFSSESEDHKLVVDLVQAVRNDINELDHLDVEPLIELGERDLALDLLTRLASPAGISRAVVSIFSKEIEAAVQVAELFDRARGIQLLENLAQAPGVFSDVRMRAVRELGKLGVSAKALAIDTFAELDPKGPFESLNWEALAALLEAGRDGDARKLGRALLDEALDQRYKGELNCHLSDLQRALPLNEITQSLKASLEKEFDPYLAICLALIGERALASGFVYRNLSRANDSLRVEAAKTLCQIGEADRGLELLKQIVLSEHTVFAVRLEAASAIAKTGYHKEADHAHLSLLTASELSIEDRCEAADYFLLDEVHRHDIVWDELSPLLFAGDLAVSEYCEVARRLMHVRDDGWSDADPWDAYDHVLSILENPKLAPCDAWQIIDMLADSWSDIETVPRLAELARSSAIPVEDRIATLRMLDVRRNAIDVGELLYAVANEPWASFYDTIEALRDAKTNEAAREQLESIIRDTDLPPKWRLRAANGEIGSWGNINVEANKVLLLDATVALRFRIEALRSIIRADKGTDVESLIAELQNYAVTSCDERLDIADLAMEHSAIAIAHEHLELATQDRPHSMHELNRIAELYEKLGDRDAALRYLKLASDLDAEVLCEIEDAWVVSQTSRLLAGLNRKTEAIGLLSRFAEYGSWYNIRDLIETVKEIDTAAVEAIAQKLVAELEEELANPGQYGVWMMLRAADFLLADGWMTSLNSLCATALNASRSVSERAEAAALLIRYGEAALSDYRSAATGRSVLNELASNPSLSIEDRAEPASKLQEAGSAAQAEELVRELHEDADQSVERRREIARVFRKLGRLDEAKAILADLDEVQDVKAGLGPLDDYLVKDIQGKSRHEAILKGQVFNESRPTFDRLLDARELVAEYGNREALELIMNAAKDGEADPDLRLEAASVLDELGYRELPRQILAEIEDSEGLDDYWTGDTFLRFGDKSKARKFLKRSIKTCPDNYRDQIARALADLNATDLLAALNAKWKIRSRANAPHVTAKEI
jgi:hypothetical protein